MKSKIYHILTFAMLLFCVTNVHSQASTPSVATETDQEKPNGELAPLEGEIFKVVEQMPRFPGCEGQNLGKKEIKDCAWNKMMEYISSNLKYPGAAKRQGIEGTTIIQFVVAKDGKLRNMKILRDLEMDKGGADGDKTCGQAALDVFHKMNRELKWIPGKQRGNLVNVQFNLPVKFKL